ncbi:chalcone isomerase family protein [Salinimonas chungwhensis]|uniref:chalcone isomerase family protein n=1 Tax=Salinimonas chungwhensis TaxID=265425 RepID=UPI0012EA24A6|nr:chalcone isomerase family protein [Salinimonas chungwhensis]
MCTHTVNAASAPVSNELENPQIVGEGKFTYYFWDVYNATLYAPDGDWDKAGSFALNLEYLRDFEGKKIAERSIEEIKKQGFTDEGVLDQWRQEMEKIFPDVSDGDSITGIATSDNATRFFLNNELIGEIADASFTEHFFNIWLGEKTSEPELRDKLIGDSSE